MILLPNYQETVFSCPISVSTRERDGIYYRHAANVRVATRFVNLSNDVKWAVVDDFHTDPRLFDIIRFQTVNDFALKLSSV